MATFDEFWGRMGPGLLETGTGLYNKRKAEQEAAQRLRTAQGPLYGQAMSGAGATLGEAGMLNPDALAANRFAAQEKLLAGPQAKDEADLMRMLYAKGMLGAANYNPGVEGIAPGTLMNPQMAAFYAARNADRAKRAEASLGQGQTYADNLVNRAGALQRVASGTQGTGITAQNTQPSRASNNAELLRGITGLFSKNSGMFKDLGGMFSGLFGGGSDGYGGDMGDLFFDF